MKFPRTILPCAPPPPPPQRRGTTKKHPPTITTRGRTVVFVVFRWFMVSVFVLSVLRIVILLMDVSDASSTIDPYNDHDPPPPSPHSAQLTASVSSPTSSSVTTSTSQQHGGLRLAIVITGSFHRYLFQSSLRHFLRPLVQQGHVVEYYVSLSMQKAPAFRSDQKYMTWQVHDPIFDSCIYEDKDHTIVRDLRSRKTQIRQLVQEQLTQTGVHFRYLTFQDTYAGMDQHTKVQQHRQRARQSHPHDDPDVRFPVLDVRNDAVMQRNANANRNMLHLFYHLQHLYQQVVRYEMEYYKYDYVFFVRDDAMWWHDFDLQSLLMPDRSSTGTTTTNKNHSHDDVVELYIPSCDARVPSMHPMEINDHILILKSDRADVYGNYFDELFRPNLLDDCAQRLEDTFRYGRVTRRNTSETSSLDQVLPLPPLLPEPVRGCNSEMILRYILLERYQVTMQTVGQAKMPFERTVLVQHPVTNAVRPCFHYFCQSHVDPLIVPPGLTKCTEMNLDTAT